MLTLAVEKREETGKRVAALRSAGRMPAVVYGPKQETTTVSIVLGEFEKALKVAGESSVLELSGLGSGMQVLIQEVDFDPVTNVPRHADFYAIEKGAKVEVNVPLTFVGESKAVKEGASLVKVMHELPIEAEPSKLPHDIEVDISVLAAIGNQIHVRDLRIPAGVEVKVEGDEVVALIQEVAVEEEAPVAGPDMDAIEVVKKGKEEGAEEAAAE